MENNMLLKKVSLALLISVVSIGAAFSSTTTIELINDKWSDETLINTSVSGTVTPAFPNPLTAHTERTHISTTLPGAIDLDAGSVRYGSCLFHWSAIKLGAFFQFSIGNDSSMCEAKVISQNFVTGDYHIRFRIKP